MLLNTHPEYAFEMVYFNADGQTSSMCGNGGRCIVHLLSSVAYLTEIINEFIAIDGLHQAEIIDVISLKMNDVSVIKNPWR